VAPKQVIRQLSPIKQLVDLHSNTLEQHAFFEYCRKGLLDKHLVKARKVYAKKRDLMITSLTKCCPDMLKWNKPEGGLFLWCQLANGMNSIDLLREAIYEKVVFIEGKTFSPKDNKDEWLRLNFSFTDEANISEGIRRLQRALLKLQKRHGIMKGKRDISQKPIV
jgi:2-aminoadipate transaminase